MATTFSTNGRHVEPLVRLDHVSKSFEEGERTRVVLHEVSADFAPGEFVVLIGKSGSGKSTLLHMLGGLDTPTNGARYFGQNNICRLPADELAKFRNRELGFVWQIQSLLGEFTAAVLGKLRQAGLSVPTEKRASDFIPASTQAAIT